MKAAVEAKFSIPTLRQALLSTRGLIVEATRHPLFGIGLPFNSHCIEDRNAWQGENLMGQILTDYRECLADQIPASITPEPNSVGQATSMTNTHGHPNVLAQHLTHSSPVGQSHQSNFRISGPGNPMYSSVCAHSPHLDTPRQRFPLNPSPIHAGNALQQQWSGQHNSQCFPR